MPEQEIASVQTPPTQTHRHMDSPALLTAWEEPVQTTYHNYFVIAPQCPEGTREAFANGPNRSLHNSQALLQVVTSKAPSSYISTQVKYVFY